MTADFSRQAFLEFFDYVSKKGLMNPTTARARKAAAKAVLGILDEEEAADIRGLDVDELMTRFSNINSSDFTPGSLTTYKSRLSKGLSDFLRFKENPLSFKPNINSRPPRSANGASKSPKPVDRAPSSPRSDVAQDSASTQGLVFPIPLRPDVTVQVAGIPSDLTPTEAKKITAVIMALGTISEKDH